MGTGRDGLISRLYMRDIETLFAILIPVEISSVFFVTSIRMTELDRQLITQPINHTIIRPVQTVKADIKL